MLDDLHESLGLGIRQRPQKHGIHDAEDRRRRAEADGERQHRDGREPRRSLEPAQRVLGIGAKFGVEIAHARVPRGVVIPGAAPLYRNSSYSAREPRKFQAANRRAR